MKHAALRKGLRGSAEIIFRRTLILKKKTENVCGVHRENIDLGFLAFIEGKQRFFAKCVEVIYRVDTRIFLYGPYRNVYSSYRFFFDRGPLDHDQYRTDLCWGSGDVLQSYR